MTFVFDPYAPEVHRDPFPLYKILRDDYPAYFSERGNCWVLSRYDDVRAVLSDKRSSADERNWNLYEKFRARAEAHGIDDGYEHDRQRERYGQGPSDTACHACHLSGPCATGSRGSTRPR